MSKDRAELPTPLEAEVQNFIHMLDQVESSVQKIGPKPFWFSKKGEIYRIALGTTKEGQIWKVSRKADVQTFVIKDSKWQGLLSEEQLLILGLSSVDYSLSLTGIGEENNRGTVSGWTYISRQGNIARLVQVQASDVRREDRVFSRNDTPGSVTIVDAEAFNAQNAPQNLEIIGLNIQRTRDAIEEIVPNAGIGLNTA